MIVMKNNYLLKKNKIVIDIILKEVVTYLSILKKIFKRCKIKSL